MFYFFSLLYLAFNLSIHYPSFIFITGKNNKFKVRRSPRLIVGRRVRLATANRSRNTCPDNVFGYDSDVSSIIMQYVGNPRTLLTLSTVNKLLRSLVTEEMVIKSALYTGGRPLASIQNIYRFMKNRSAFVASPLRLLRMVTGIRCEFCNNVTVDVRFAYPGEDLSNAKPRTVRPQWNVFACWSCCKTRRNPTISGTWDHDRLTKTFDRTILSMQGYFHENVFYTSNRALLYKIFCHPRIVAYPCGLRYCHMVNGVLENAFDPRHFELTMHDRMELMWACFRTDCTDEPVGPLFHRGLISDLVSYLKKKNNRGIEYFINNCIPRVPKLSDYDGFVTVYEQNITRALQLNEQRRNERMRILLHRRYRWIENVVHAIAVVVSCINLRVLRHQLKACQSLEEKYREVKIASKVMLCYHEAYSTSLKRPVTYRTGNRSLDTTINMALTELFRNPSRVIESRAISKQYARTLFIKIRSSNVWWCGISRMITDENGDVIASFSAHDPYSNRTRRRKITQWRDTSSFRNP